MDQSPNPLLPDSLAIAVTLAIATTDNYHQSMTPRPKKWLSWSSIIIGTLVLGFLAFIAAMAFSVFHAHEHCIKATGLAFRTYALDHFGKLPFDTNGLGNALLLLVRGGYLGDTNGQYSIGYITGPGDNGAVFKEALKTGARIPEEKCSRIYIQGLSEKNNPEIAILFDAKPTPGGDHFRRPWGPLLREVCLLDGSMHVIPEKHWPAFSSIQVELLVREGIPRVTAKKLYQMR